MAVRSALRTGRPLPLERFLVLIFPQELCVPVDHSEVSRMLGRAIAQAVSCRLPTAAARVRSCGIYGGQNKTGAVLSEYFGFPCQSSFHQLLHNHHHLSSGAGTIGQ
jgi:hypothetical protein